MKNRKTKYNLIHFNKETVSNGFSDIPNIIKDVCNLKPLEETEGCIRTLEDKVVAIYFWVTSDIQKRAIVKFTIKENNLAFDSIYIRRELINKKEFGEMENSKDYRYDENLNLIATYDFSLESIFCIQNKGKKNTKSYTSFPQEKYVNKPLQDCSNKYLTQALSNETFSAFHTTKNSNEIYWLIQ
jgi:hypothetical protein